MSLLTAHPVTNVTELSEFQNILNSNSKVIVKFTANWCGPCKKIAPTYVKLCKQYDSRIVFLEVDVDKAEPALISYTKVSGIPRFIAFQDNKILDDIVGSDQKKLIALVEKMNA